MRYLVEMKNVTMMKNKNNNTTDTYSEEIVHKNSITLKNCAIEDRPREKMIAKGKKELSNAELIAILIGSGSVGQSAVELAKEILHCYGDDLSQLSRQSIGSLTKNFKGMGEAKAISILAALELGYRMLSETRDIQDTYIKNSDDLFRCVGEHIIDLPTEEFWTIYMNHKGKVLFKQRITAGGITETPVDIRKIFSIALEKNAVKIALAHNHPSGHLNPSIQDKTLTDNIIQAGKILHITVVDHIIVGVDDRNHPDYYSFHDNGLL